MDDDGGGGIGQREGLGQRRVRAQCGGEPAQTELQRMARDAQGFWLFGANLLVSRL